MVIRLKSTVDYFYKFVIVSGTFLFTCAVALSLTVAVSGVHPNNFDVYWFYVAAGVAFLSTTLAAYHRSSLGIWIGIVGCTMLAYYSLGSEMGPLRATLGVIAILIADWFRKRPLLALTLLASLVVAVTLYFDFGSTVLLLVVFVLSIVLVPLFGRIWFAYREALNWLRLRYHGVLLFITIYFTLVLLFAVMYRCIEVFSGKPVFVPDWSPEDVQLNIWDVIIISAWIMATGEPVSANPASKTVAFLCSIQATTTLLLIVIVVEQLLVASIDKLTKTRNI